MLLKTLRLFFSGFSTFVFLIFSFQEVAVASPKITQAGFLYIPGYPSVDVRVIEECEKDPRLEFYVLGKGKIFSFEPGKSSPEVFRPSCEFAYTNPFLRYKVFHIEGLPKPIILAVGVAYGGSDSYYESNLVAFVNGEFKILNQDPLVSNNDGGIFIGFINRTVGHGIISWNFVWGDEAHFQPHRYRIQIFSWDPGHQCLRKTKDITTKKKYKGWKAAFVQLGLPLENFIQTIVSGEHSTLSLEEKMSEE